MYKVFEVSEGLLANTKLAQNGGYQIKVITGLQFDPRFRQNFVAIIISHSKASGAFIGLVGEQTLKSHAYIHAVLNLQLGTMIDTNLVHRYDNRNISL